MQMPAGAQISPTGGGLTYTWATTTSDTRALQYTTGTGRVASTWHHDSVLEFDVNLSDGRSRQIALYAVDFDSLGRAQRVDVVNAATGAVLDTQQMSNLAGGQYLTWQISGHVRIRATRLAGMNAVISALFLGAPSSGTTATASFVRLDTATRGSWKGVYGDAGHVLAGVTAAPPSWAAVTPPSAAAASTYTWTTSTTDVRALQRPSGTDRFASTWYKDSTFTFDVNISDAGSHEIAVYAVDFDNLSRSQRVQVVDAATNTVLDSRDLSGFSGGQYLVWQVSGRVQFRITRIGGMNAVVSGLFFGGGSAAAASATFVREDGTTGGSWKGFYGSAGHVLYGETAVPPAWASVTAPAASTWTWAASTPDLRALQRPAGTDRFAATWHSTASFQFDINITDGAPHDVALYMVDFDNYMRSQRVDVIDAATQTVLHTRTVSGFSGGRYLVWRLTGRVQMRVTWTGGINAVASGLFFGGAAAPAGNSATFVRTDTTTRGTWKGVYGAAGHVLAGETAAPPQWAAVTPPAASTWVWAGSTTDTRALQRPAGSDRSAVCWYGTGSYLFDLNLADGALHEVALYLIDFDNYARTQRVEVLDAVTNAVLDSRDVSAFSGGQYLLWRLSGRVRIRITHTGGINAVASGLFFNN